MIKAHLKTLLDALDAISEKDDGLTDTDVRERMYEAVYNGFIIQTPAYALPSDYCLYNVQECNEMVRRALAEFISGACKSGSATAEERFSEFQDHAVVSDRGHDFNWYFGSADNLDQLRGFDRRREF